MPDTNIVERVQVVSKKIDKIKERKAQLEGQRTQLFETLKTKFEVNTLAEAEILLDEYERQEQEIREKLEAELKLAEEMVAKVDI